MTAMRLHKLLYYCQGWHLAWYGRPLFADRIEAWKYGPVVPAVYDQPRGKGRDPLPDAGDPDGMSAAARESVEQVWSHYRQLSACGPRDKTHTGSRRCSFPRPPSLESGLWVRHTDGRGTPLEVLFFVTERPTGITVRRVLVTAVDRLPGWVVNPSEWPGDKPWPVVDI